MSYSDILDQAVPIRFVRNIVASGRIPNGLLFWGPAGVGKRLSALETAKAINCESGSGDGCGTCISCRKIEHGNHADVKVIAPSGRGRIIDVEAVDTINELASYRPFEARWRVVIIQDAERMGVPAQNHFLKTLEEPPSNTLFIMITEFPRLLLPTIRSRCQQVRFGGLRPETVTRLLLRDRDLPPATAAAIAALSQGQMSRALDLVDSGRREVVLDVARRLHGKEDPMAVSEEFVAHLRSQAEMIKNKVKSEVEALDTEEASKEDLEEAKREQAALIEALVRHETMEYLYLFKTWYRDALVYRTTGNPAQLLNRDQEASFSDAGKGDIEAKLAALEKAWLYINRNLSTDRVFRDLFFVLAPATA